MFGFDKVNKRLLFLEYFAFSLRKHLSAPLFQLFQLRINIDLLDLHLVRGYLGSHPLELALAIVKVFVEVTINSLNQFLQDLDLAWQLLTHLPERHLHALYPLCNRMLDSMQFISQLCYVSLYLSIGLLCCLLEHLGHFASYQEIEVTLG
jgi:hypothetical protein